MIEAFDFNQFGMAGLFIGYLIYDRTVLLKKLLDMLEKINEKLK